MVRVSVFADEEILVVPRDRLPALPQQAFIPGDPRGIVDVVRACGTFLPRAMVEDDPAYKQVIPYLVVRCGGRVFLFHRVPGAGDGRLQGLYSIGVGGHISRADAERSADPVQAGLRRELLEELVLDGPYSVSGAGLLNDDTNPVGRVHLGLVYVVDLARPAIRVREEDRLSGRLSTWAEVAALRDRLESWSRLIVDAGSLSAP
jgi:predicted NUDIX family phosphoesterase